MRSRRTSSIEESFDNGFTFPQSWIRLRYLRSHEFSWTFSIAARLGPLGMILDRSPAGKARATLY